MNFSTFAAPTDSCCCPSDDAYACWAIRYELPTGNALEIEEDGGPCMCVCHEAIEGFEEEFGHDR